MNLQSRHLVVDDVSIVVAPVAKKAGAKLCDFCSMRDLGCNLPAVEDRCREFTPALSFVPPIIGLDGYFSTFRASSIWYERARVVFNTHKRVGLYNSATGELIAPARLTGAFRGPFHELMKHHSASNHLSKAAKILSGESDTWLPRKIRNLAGSRYVKRPDQTCSVIYMVVDGQ
jgi:hypothetical protein